MSDVLTTAKEIATLAAATAALIAALRAARQSKQVTDDIRRGAQAYTDVRGNPDSNVDRERRGLIGDIVYLLGDRNETSDGVIRQLTKQLRQMARKQERLEDENQLIKQWLRLKGVDIPPARLVDSEFEDSSPGIRRIPTLPGSRRNTPTGGGEGNSG